MKHFNIKTALSILLLYTMTACNKELDKLRPHNVIFEEQQFSTPEGFTKATWGIYSLVAGRAAGQGFNYNDMFLYLSEAHGNNLKPLAIGINKSLDAFEYKNSGESDLAYTYDYWRGSYTAITQINKALANIKPGETNKVILQAQAELLFLRALVYFNTVRLFGKPYYQEPDKNPGVMLIVTDNNGLGFAPPRATVKEVYEQIIADLTTAVPLFSMTKTNSFANKYAAFGLLSRVYLYMGGTMSAPDESANKKAREYADSVITNGGYTLLQAGAYTSYYSTDNPGNKEDIFAINTQYSTGSLSSMYAMPSQINYSGGLYRPSPDLLGLMAPNDLRKNFFVKNVTPGNPDDSLATVKYMNGYVSIYNTSPNRYLRLAEMYLNRAEAAVKSNDNDAALKDLNVIRSRAGVGDTSNITGQPLFDEILKQRRLELAFEGHNGFDYFRNGLPMVRNYASANSPALTIQANDPKVVYRIPFAEAIANPNLKPNEQ